MKQTNLECLECGKQLYKRVCFLMINGEPIGDEYGIAEYDFCSKKCAMRWRDKNTTFEYNDVDIVTENRK